MIEQIRAFVQENFLFGSDDCSLGDEDSLLESGVVDSTGILELVSFAEQRFGIEVKDQELIPENLDSIGNLARYIRRKQEMKRQAS